MSRLGLDASVVLVLVAAPALGHEQVLSGSEWAAAGEEGARVPFIRFGESGRVAGSGGCNRFRGSYQQSGDGLTFSPLAATRMACPPEVMRRERAFFDMLSHVRGMRMGTGELVLLDGEGRERAVLTRRTGAAD
ncbi:META domain-containing protein [Aestuariivirga sp.]|uniref:META domain-containing protein n=1 Tax=Aestuariivirga sp. TaxID=2650926 RepID=UPI00391B6178